MLLEELLEMLKVKYPDKLPSKELTNYELGKLIGQQEVIKYLYSVLLKNTKVIK